MSIIKTLEVDEQLQTELTAAGEKLVVVYYSASWCLPCKKMKPVVEQLSQKHPNVVFLKLDVDTCQTTAIEQGVTAMPTFAFHKKMEKIDVIQGADPVALEEKIVFYTGAKDVKLPVKDEIQTKDIPLISGHEDLLPYILMDYAECMNESDENNFKNVFHDNDTFLQSSVDAQLIMSVVFKQPVKLHSFKIKAPTDSGPKDLKIFINQPNTLGFDSAESNSPVQNLRLNAVQLNGTPINLQYVKYQNVINIQFFVKNNQKSTPKTTVKYLAFIGTPISSSNGGDFKRPEVPEKGSVKKKPSMWRWIRVNKKGRTNAEEEKKPKDETNSETGTKSKSRHA